MNWIDFSLTERRGNTNHRALVADRRCSFADQWFGLDNPVGSQISMWLRLYPHALGSLNENPCFERGYAYVL